MVDTSSGDINDPDHYYANGAETVATWDTIKGGALIDHREVTR